MSQRFVTGLVVGKFSPLHRGHEYLIETARERCEKIIVISYSNPEFVKCEAEARERWLKPLLGHNDVLVVVDVNKGWPPANDEVDEWHRLFCAQIICDQLCSTVDAVFTSEDYGDGFAKYLDKYQRNRKLSSKPVQHVLVDQARVKFPISGGAARTDLRTLMDNVSDHVAVDFVPRIAVLGGESSGKSTLVKALGRALQTRTVEEYGRTFCETIRHVDDLQPQDLLTIARHQVLLEQQACKRQISEGCGMVPVICDTSPLTTLFYSKELFGRASEELNKLAWRKYDLVIVCDPNIEFVQDGQRKDEEFRERGYNWALSRAPLITWDGKSWLIVKGSVQERVQQVLQALGRAVPDAAV